MKISLEKERILFCIKMVSKAMSSRSTIPVLSGIHIYTSADGVVFETSDLDTSIKHVEEALVEEAGATVVPGKLFSEIIGSLPKSLIVLETKGEKLEISCESTKFNISTLNALDFPPFPQIIPSKSIVIKAEQLQKMVKKVEKAVSRDISRAVLTGISFKTNNSILELAATDSYRLTITKEKISTSEGSAPAENINVVIPGNILNEVCKLASEEDMIKIGESENQLIFIFGMTSLISRKVEGNYPNYEQIVPTQKNVSIVVETELFLGAVRRVSIVAKNTSPIKISFHTDTQQIEISAHTPDVGEALEKIPAQIDGEGIEIGFNYQYILDGLNVIDDKEILIEAQTPIKPGIFKSIGSDEFFYLTMPVRLER